MQSEIKKNIQGTNSEEKETGFKSTIWNRRKQTSAKTEWRKRIQKYEERLRNLWNNFKCSNIRIIGMPEGEKEEQEIENLLENIIKKNFPNLAKEIDFQEVQEAQSPKEVGRKEVHTKAHHNYITQE